MLGSEIAARIAFMQRVAESEDDPTDRAANSRLYSSLV